MTWAYVAGFFDGEGHISLGQRYPEAYSYTFYVGMSQKDASVLERIASFLRSEGVHPCPKLGDSSKDCHQLLIANRSDVARFLTFVMPWLTGKKTKAQDTLRMLKLYPRRRVRHDKVESKE